jgi:CRP/FNR family transcriptional regulator, cyclic AMP receptor protein
LEPKRTSKPPFDLKAFLTTAKGGQTSAEYRTNDLIFLQGDTANAIFYIKEGKVKLTVVSQQGKEAVVAILGPGDFFGEGCLAGQRVRIATAVAISECSVVKLEKAVVLSLLHQEPSFSELFIAHLLSRYVKLEEDLVDQLLNSSSYGEFRAGRHYLKQSMDRVRMTTIN